MGTVSLPSNSQLFIDPCEKLRAIFTVSRTTESTLPSNTVATLHSVFESLQAMVANVVRSVNAEEFSKRRAEALPRYAKLLCAASLIVQADVADETFSNLACDSLEHLHQEFISSGIDHFGSQAAEQVSYCIFTLKRINRRLPRLSTPLLASCHQEDRNLSMRFAVEMLLAHFHLDCLRNLLKHHNYVSSAVVTEVLDGMAACTNAYALLCEGLELRENPRLSLDETAVWDEEDQVLLDESDRTGSPIM